MELQWQARSASEQKLMEDIIAWSIEVDCECLQREAESFLSLKGAAAGNGGTDSAPEGSGQHTKQRTCQAGSASCSPSRWPMASPLPCAGDRRCEGSRCGGVSSCRHCRASAAVGHEAAAHAAAQRAEKQPAAHAPATADEWGRAAAAWRAAHDALDAAGQADPGSEAVQRAGAKIEAVQRAAAEMEAALVFRRQLQGEQE